MRRAVCTMVLAMLCAASPPCGVAFAQSSPAPPLVVATESIDALWGAPLVVPLRDQAGRRGSPAIVARAAGLGELPCIHREFEVRPTLDSRAEGTDRTLRMLRWLPDPGVWSSRPALADRPSSSALDPASVSARWSMAIVTLPNLPQPEALPEAIEVAGDLVRVRWLRSPEELLARYKQLRPGSLESPWRATLPAAAPLDDTLTTLLRSEARNPWTRWRVKLVLDGLHPDGSSTSREIAPPFEDGSLEAIALWQESRVRSLLASVAVADLELALRFSRRLGLIAEVAADVWVPAWNPDPRPLEALLATMSQEPSRGLDALVREVGAWLQEQPKAAAWVQQDAGVLAEAEDQQAQDTREVPSRYVLPTICVTNLGDQRTLAWASSPEQEEGGNTDLTPVEQGRTLCLIPTALLSSRPTSEDTSSPPRTSAIATRHVRVHAGSWSTQLECFATPLEVRPPGLVTGRWHTDPMLAQWIQGAVLASDDPAPVAAMIMRAAPRDDAPDVARWEVYFECSAALGDRPLGSAMVESVTIAAGPAGLAGFVVRVSREGAPLLLGKGALEENAVLISREAGRWMARVRLPASAVGRDGMLRVGLWAVDDRGVRWSWPRATPPWQDEPSRVAIDVRAWDR